MSILEIVFVRCYKRCVFLLPETQVDRYRSLGWRYWSKASDFFSFSFFCKRKWIFSYLSMFPDNWNTILTTEHSYYSSNLVLADPYFATINATINTPHSYDKLQRNVPPCSPAIFKLNLSFAAVNVSLQFCTEWNKKQHHFCKSLAWQSLNSMCNAISV